MFYHFGRRGGFGGHHRLMHKLFGFGRHGWDHHDHGHRRGGRGRRMLDQGDLRFILLHLIAEKPSHGYELIKAVEEKFGGAYSPSPGVIYPTLTLLEEYGYLRSEVESGNKKLYTITDEGSAFLAQNGPTVEAILGRMNEAASHFGGGPAPEIRRAAENLRMALKIRITRGATGPDETRRIVEALDRAAAEIERG